MLVPSALGARKWEFILADAISEPVIATQPVAARARVRPGMRRFTGWILLFLALIWVANHGISLLIRHTHLQRKITARLQSAFGRPVEVGSYDFSLWGWPTLRAQSVTVAEDPRFGYEYFLRTDTLTMRLRWRGLIRGRLEFGTLALARPSLNLVRESGGDWNLAEWLPRPVSPQTPSGAAPVGPPAPPSSPLRFTRIQVAAGRINFKRGAEKLPFAFTAVTGYVEPDGAGRWRLDLEAVPLRAAVNLQQAGTLHLSGLVGGTSSRLRPAALDLSWADASISDVLRLARGYDYGVRGFLGVTLNAHAEGDSWIINARTGLRQLHRWDLPSRADNPAVNLSGNLKWNPATSALVFDDISIEGPHSNARARGAISWSPIRVRSEDSNSPLHIELRSSEVDLSDLLAWFRAFHSGVADDVAVHGSAKLAAAVRGWPWQLGDATLELSDAELSSPRLRVPVSLRATRIHYDQRGVFFTPIALRFGAENGPFAGFVIADGGTSEQAIKGASNLRLVGRITQIRDVVATAGALGWNVSRGWDVGGSAAFEFLWLGSPYPWRAEPRGTIEWGGEAPGGSLAAPFLNLPVEHVRASYAVRPGVQGIEIRSADAFGGHWKGNVAHAVPNRDWQFNLTAEHLAAADLDRWLNPRWRNNQSFFARVLPFFNSSAPSTIAPENLRARGNISVEQFTLAPFVLHRLEGDLSFDGRRLQVMGARAEFYGGDLTGTFEAQLNPLPAYHVVLNYAHVDLAAFSAASAPLANLFSGSAAGQISLTAAGSARSDLLASLACQGAAHVAGAELHNLTSKDSPLAAFLPGPRGTFRDASASFTCSNSKIEFQEVSLLAPNAELNGSGSLTFSRALDFRLGVFSAPGAANIPKPPRAPVEAFHLTGPLAKPIITRATAPAARP
jgi:hypothetical protein